MLIKKQWILFVLLFIYAGLYQLDAQPPYAGYTLYSKMGSTKVNLLNMSGGIYHQWNCTGQTGYSVHLLPGGTLVRSAVYSGNQLWGAAMCGMVQKYDYNGSLIWQYVHSTSTYCTHHDICPMPNGNVLLIAYEVKTAAQVTAAGSSKNITVWPEKIIEVQPTGTNTGTIVWEWHVWDHLIQDYSSSKPNYGVVADHPELLDLNYNLTKDWMHVNGISYNEQLDQIVFSSHYLNEFYVIDHSTTTAEAASHSGGNSGHGGDFLYRWGNPQAYDRGNSSNRIFNVVHDAHWIPQGYPNANSLVAFNNKGSSTNGSCVDIISPPYNGYNYSLNPGAAYSPPTSDWRHNCLGTAQDMCNSQQLPNGNMLVCIASTGYIYEIDSNQSLVWSYTAGGSVAKAFRYTADYIAGALFATATATQAFICTGNSSQLNVSTNGINPAFSWSSNPAGFSSTLQNPIVTPALTTTYTVTVTTASDTVSSTTTVSVFPLPSAPFITQLGYDLHSSAGTGNQWFYDSTIIAGATGQTYTPTQDGIYQVRTTDTNGCTSALSDPYNFIGTGISGGSETEPVRLFPNPASNALNIAGSKISGSEFSFMLSDFTGKIFHIDRNTKVLDLSGLADGLYLIRFIFDDSTVISRKFNICH